MPYPEIQPRLEMQREQTDYTTRPRNSKKCTSRSAKKARSQIADRKQLCSPPAKTFRFQSWQRTPRIAPLAFHQIWAATTEADRYPASLRRAIPELLSSSGPLPNLGQGRWAQKYTELPPWTRKKSGGAGTMCGRPAFRGRVPVTKRVIAGGQYRTSSEHQYY